MQKACEKSLKRTDKQTQPSGRKAEMPNGVRLCRAVLRRALCFPRMRNSDAESGKFNARMLTTFDIGEDSGFLSLHSCLSGLGCRWKHS